MQGLVQSLASIYSDRLEQDTRTPTYTFSVPGIDGGSIGILTSGGPLAFWVQMATILPMQSIVRVFLACIVYKFIIQRRGTLMAYLVGYGFVLPFVILLPFYVIPLLGIRNVCLMIAISSTPIFVTFNCLEAMYGTSPPIVERDLWTYCIYYSSPIPFLISDKTQQVIKASKEEITSKAKACFLNIVLTSLLLSVLIPFAYEPFSSPRQIGQPLDSFLDIFHTGHLLNNYILACLTFLCLDGGTLAVAVTIGLLTGFSTVTVMHAPMTESLSPSEFWGKRWNRMIHAVLKRAVYLPLRKYAVSKTAASIITFVVSGLLHEYILAIIYLKGNMSPEEQRRNYGMHMAFFAYNGIVVLIERALKGNKYIEELLKPLPKPAITALVILTVIPVSHWFTDEYVMSGFYTDYSLGFPKIVYIPNEST
jgi:hypothetical protein